ncbi:MAG: DUF3604 domain-containing protein [Gammaproteobacteria bacterium]|nr:DUF3604 domain-containing protein [Gammaproteobacteria bacterium]
MSIMKRMISFTSLIVLFSGVKVATAQEWAPDEGHMLEESRAYSPYVDQHFPNRVFWGDTHHHTILSFDSGLMGTRLGPEDSFRFARGEEVISNTGLRAKLMRPFDFLVVSDHAEYLGIADQIRKAEPGLLATEYGKRWFDMYRAGRAEGFKAASEVFFSITRGEELVKSDKLKRSVWDRVIDIASTYNEPGKFTALNGYEWTSAPGPGNNLHRVVIFRDGPDRVKQVLPFSAFDSDDPEDLWRYLADYEEKTGGQVLAIPHNGNASNGLMFAKRTLKKKRLSKAYAQARMRWEPLFEVTQSKGDSETHPFLSTDDEFADYERWDFGNFTNPSVPKEDWMLQYEYARSALRLGLKFHDALGVNPFKFGMIGSTDSHIGMSTTREENFFGKLPTSEPSPERWKHSMLVMPDGRKTGGGWMEQASGLAAVWARENTREELFDAMVRKEVYATTGTRVGVRVFAGWDFAADEVERPDFAAHGYGRGVPMGGDLTDAPPGKAPGFMVRALRDPDGANLDRIQIIKGWMDKKGVTHERIHDVAVSDGRKTGANGRCETPVGNTVDIQNASYTNSIGDALLMAYWEDPDFNPAQRAFYYVRVIEIPTPRWTAYDAKRFGVKMPDHVPMTVTERAYTSPIWYTP